MKMLMIVFRQSLEDDLQKLLQSLDVKAFTEAPKVFGIGEAGTALGSMGAGSNSMILAAMENQQADQVTKQLQTFRDHLLERQHGAKIPMRVFALPCERLL